MCKCGFDTIVPVKRTKWMTSTWDCTLSHGCVLWASRLTIWTALVSVSSLWNFSGHQPGIVLSAMDVSTGPHDWLYGLLWCPCLPCGASLDSFFTCCSQLSPHPRPPTPSATLAQNWCAPSKNDLKWLKIKQVTNFKSNYIKFSISISTILLNIAGLTRAKPDYNI